MRQKVMSKRSSANACMLLGSRHRWAFAFVTLVALASVYLLSSAIPFSVLRRYSSSASSQPRVTPLAPIPMATHKLKFLTHPARTKHTATVLFLHGLGDTGAGWEPVAQMLGQKETLSHIKWILPHAPRQPCTLNGGAVMPSWYDIYELASEDFLGRTEDDAGLIKSRESIKELILAEIEAGIPANRILLGGFSQGGAVTLLSGLTAEPKLAGLAVLSTYLPLPGKLKEWMQPHASSLPIFYGHGTADPLIPIAVAEKSLEILKQHGVGRAVERGGPGVEFRRYQGLPHSADPQEIAHLGAFLEKVLPA